MTATYKARTFVSFLVSLVIAAVAAGITFLQPGLWGTASGLTIMGLIAWLAVIWNVASLLSLLTIIHFQRKGRPESEGAMIGRIYRLLSVVVILLTVAYGFGRLNTFGTLFSLFGGMILGWSLQAPVSGFAAYILVSMKRPFRPGDRVQFPNLGLTGDVKDIGPMYVTLDQVGGTVGSEEAVGRFILVPNAMLFSQVVINYTVLQEAAFMLDEVVVRVTYDSDMEKVEQILTDAARKITKDIIESTHSEPYIRSDLYDYGLYMRLRFQTAVKDRARIAYELNKEILKQIQRAPSVDLAIPFIYSYRAGLADMENKEEDAVQKAGGDVRQIEVAKILDAATPADPRDIEQLSRSIAVSGLLQPIIVQAAPGLDRYEVVAGSLRLAACKHLGWKTVPAVVRRGTGATGAETLRKGPTLEGSDAASLTIP